MSTDVVSTLGIPATAAEVYIVYTRFSVGQLQLMRALIDKQESVCNSKNDVPVVPGEVSPDHDLKSLLDRIIIAILDEKTSVQMATILLDYVKIYSGLSSVVGPGAKSIDSFLPEPSRNQMADCFTTPPGEVKVSVSLPADKPTAVNCEMGNKFSEFEAKYVTLMEQTSSKAYVRDIKSSFNWLTKEGGSAGLDFFDAVMLEQLFAREFGRARHNAARFYRTLKAAFNKAVSWHYIEENPFVKFRLPKIPETAAAYVTEADLSAILSQRISIDYKDLFIFAFDTGMRLGEIVNLKWASLHLSENEIDVTNSRTFTTKGKKERTIPISARLHKTLADRHARMFAKGNPTYVFERRGKKFNSGYASRKFKQVVRAAGLDENLHFHSCRHGFGSSLIRANVNPVHVQQLMGHSDLSTTLRYVHANKDDLEQAIKKLDLSKTSRSNESPGIVKGD